MQFLILVLFVGPIISACSSSFKTEEMGTRTNLVKPNGQSRVIVTDFRKKLRLEPIDPGWYHYRFSGTKPMIVTFQKKQKIASLRCEVNNAGSILFRHVSIPLTEYPQLEWKWFVERNVESPIDETTSSGDDAAARLFVSFAVPDEEPRRMEIIWARQLAAGSVKKTHGFNHLVLRGKGDEINRWFGESVDLRKLYRKFWSDGKAATVDLIGFMCDTDNTGGTAISYFADVVMAKPDKDSNKP